MWYSSIVCSLLCIAIVANAELNLSKLLRTTTRRAYNGTKVVEYSSEWAVHLNHDQSPHSLVELGFEVVGPVANLDNIYVVRHKETFFHHQKGSKWSPSHSITASLLDHPHVKWAEQQVIVQQHKRTFADPSFSSQWHLVNTGQFEGVAGEDVNIQSAWKAGYTGIGVQVAIVDDGYQFTHPDLGAHYVASASHNFNDGSGSDPSPNLSTDFHGTSAAGVAIAAANSVCGVGSAYEASAAGIRLISQGVTPATEASGVTFANQVNDIYSNSWGPSDDGLVVGPQAPLTTQAITNAVTSGRGGLGNVYVWAGGNGKQNGDNCNYDGYANSRFVIAVGAVGNDGKQAYYSENCASLIVAAPSSSGNEYAGIRTTDLLGKNGYSSDDCDSGFGGTSSACPLVAGITALVLQANPKLGWRDVVLVLAKTARKNDPTDSDWATNAAGFHVNHKYGFGVVDATAAVNSAKTHTNLQAELSSSAMDNSASTIPFSSATGVTRSLSISDSFTVERVVVTVSINFAYSNDLQIELKSPQGTTSILAEPHGNFPTLVTSNNVVQLGLVEFGPEMPFTPITGTVVATTPADACSSITNCGALKGNIAYINVNGSCYCDTDVCNWAPGVKAAQACGAIAVIYWEPDSSNGATIYTLLGSDSSVTIPSGYLSYSDQTSLNLPGTKVSLVQHRDPYNNYIPSWSFTSVRAMGEQSQGTWTVNVFDPRAPANSASPGSLNNVQISVYGSSSTFTGSYASTLPTSFAMLALVVLFALF